jgi:hypothetical protein
MRDVFYPTSVAVVGVSAKPDNLGRNIMLNLIDFGYEGVVYPVGPNGGVITSRRIYESVLDIPDEVDMAVIRPPIATKRLSVDDRGRVVYRYKHPFRDGSTHVVLEPLDFIARLAALIPRPRLNLTRFHGVFAPNFKHRKRIVPQRTQRTVEGDKPVAPMSWMQRLKRAFAIDIETCPECGGKLRVIACIEDPPLIAKILGHVRRREALIGNTARSPPVIQPELTLT